MKSELRQCVICSIYDRITDVSDPDYVLKPGEFIVFSDSDKRTCCTRCEKMYQAQSRKDDYKLKNGVWF